MEQQKNNPQEPQQPQRDIDQNRNETLQDPGAQVADYGRSGHGTGLSNEGSDGQPETRHGNSSIPMDEEDTLGTP
jgi:hypothetical protein